MQRLLTELEQQCAHGSRSSAETMPAPQLPSVVVAALDAFPMQVAIVDLQGTILATNESWRRFAADNGGTASACDVGSSYVETCRRAADAGDDSAGEVDRALRGVLKGELSSFELQYPCHAPHEPRWFVVRIVPFEVAGRRCALVTHENVTQRRMSRVMIDVLSLVATRTANGVIITDADGRTEWVNEAFVTMTGWSRAELFGRKPGDLLQGEDSDGAGLDALRTAMRSARAVTTTLLNYRRDGTPFYVELRVEPVFDDAGELRGFVGVHVDVTEKLQYEQHAEDAARHERERIAVDLHDGLGQELTGARLLVSAARATLRPDHRGAPMLDRAIEALNLASASARALARGLAPPEYVPGGIAAQLAALARRMSIDGVVQVALDAEATVETAAAATEQLLRIAQEAVSNAVRHGGAALVVLKLARDGSRIRLEIVDDGRGFDPLSITKGLGLASMQHRAAVLHGALHVDSAPGRGTKVVCTIPGGISAPSAART